MTTANLKLLAGSVLDGVALSVTSAETDYPVSYLQNGQPSWKWRSTSTADQVFTVDLGEDTPLSAFALYNHNLTADSTIRIEVAVDAGYSTLVLDTTIAGQEPVYGLGEGPLGMMGLGGFSDEAIIYPFTVHWFTVVIGRYVRITISDPTNPDGFLQAGRLMMGQEWTPGLNHDWGASMVTRDDSTLRRTRGGGLRATPHTPYRQIEVSFGWLDETDLGELERIKTLTGRRGDALLSVYPQEGGTRERLYTALGRLTDWAPNVRQRTGFYSTAFTLEEAR